MWWILLSFCCLLLTGTELDIQWLWPPCVADADIIFLPSGFFFYLTFFPRLIPAVADWMSTILPHIVWPWCEFRMQVWNVLHAASWKYRTQKNRYFGTIAQLCRAISSQLRHVSTIGKKLVKQQYVLHMFPQHAELWPTSGWDRFTSLRHPCKFLRLSRLGSITARQSSSERQPNFVALNRWRHLCLAGRPSRWALAHISS